MDYRQIVAKNEKAFEISGYLRLAKDLANLLDMVEFSIPSSDKWNYNTGGLVKERCDAFNKFCAVCLAAGISLPPLEEVFYKVPLHNLSRSALSEAVVTEQKRVKNHVHRQLSGNRSKNAKLCRSLQIVMDLFPQPGYGRFDEEKMIAMMNLLLVEGGCEPIRPDYSKIQLSSSRITELPEEVKVLVVDDNKDAALKTAIALAGWSGVSVEFYLYRRESNYGDLKGEALEKALCTTAQAVLERNSHIILMDQGLGDIKGSDLIKKIKEISDTPPLFVGNTNGSDNELRAAGAFDNCDKGTRSQGLLQALAMMK